MYDQLPLLPEDLEVVFIRPRNYTDNPLFAKQHERELEVRKNHMKVIFLFKYQNYFL